VLSAAWIISVSLALQQAPRQEVAPAAPTQWTDDRPFTRLPQNLFHDVKSLANRDALQIAAIGLASAGLVHPADQDLSSWVRDAGASRSYTPIGELIGNAWLQGGAAIATYTIGKVQESPEIAHIGSDLVRAQILNAVITVSTKVAVERTRPDGGGRSFPSGHVSATFTSAAVLSEHYGWKVGIPAYAVSGFIGWTRIRDRQHWISDVVFGGAVGILAGKVIVHDHKRQWTIVPAAGAQSAGVFVVKNSRN
jgi:membrane-associated phospholipid phosphatase